SDSGNDVAGSALPLVVEDLQVDEACVGSDTAIRAAGRRTRSSDNARYVRAMTVIVTSFSGAARKIVIVHIVPEVLIRCDAAIDNGDSDALSGSGPPVPCHEPSGGTRWDLFSASQALAFNQLIARNRKNRRVLRKRLDCSQRQFRCHARK